jgi:hypothetical protein
MTCILFVALGNSMIMKLKFKTILFFYCIFSFIIVGVAQAEKLKEEDKLNQMPGNTNEASLLIDQIAGVYKRGFKNGNIDGTTYLSENILEIVKVVENIIYFKFRLEFFNGHSCFLFGTAYYTSDKAFLFKGNAEEGDCNLKIIVTAEDIKFIDGAYGGNTCRDYCCGARGGLDGVSFKRSIQRPIKYMKLLKNSEHYQESIKALTKK